MVDELVFTVEKSKAKEATRVTLAEVGLTERADLQEWVLEHPAILGGDVAVVTFEFALWTSSSGPAPQDRLDVLGLDRSGRLVIAELKRAAAPETVEMQAIKYAALASSFTPATVAWHHAQFLRKVRQEIVTEKEALDRLEAHVETGVLTEEALAAPRIVLLAGSFSPTVTTTVAWLRKQGVDITLMRFQAYRTELETIVTVSQFFPIRELGSVGPRAPSAVPVNTFPVIEWTANDYVKLHEVSTNVTIFALLNLCSGTPGIPVSLDEAEAITKRTRGESKGDLAGLTMMVKKRFGRRNWPFIAAWASGGSQQMYYSMSDERAAVWREAAGSLGLATDDSEASLDTDATGPAL